MPVLNIAGRKVSVGDEFLKLSPEQQDATVDEIANELGLGKPAQAAPSVDMSTAIGRGAAQGVTLGGYDEMRGLVEAGGAGSDQPASLGALVRGGLNILTGGGQKEYEAGSQRARQEFKTAQEQRPIATGAGEVGGALATGLGLGGAGLSFGVNAARAGHGLGRAAIGSLADGAILGGAQGAASADDGERVRGATTGAGVGAAAGLAMPLAVAGVANSFRRAVTPLPTNAERQIAAAILQREGIDLTAGQMTGSRGLRYAEGEIGGNAAENIIERQGEQFTRAALSRAGVNANRATPDVIDDAFRRIGGELDGLAQRNTLIPDRQLVADLQNVVSQYGSVVPDSLRAPVVTNVAQDIVDAVRRGAISGESYQHLRSQIDRAARTAKANPELSTALRGMRETVDDAMERSIAVTNPADAGAWQEARRQYRNMLVLEKAASGAGENAALGIISPSQLRNATVQQGRRSYVRGQGDFSELARSGEALMKPLPQSGTAPRLRAQNLGAMIPAALGATAGAGVVGGPVGVAAGAIAGAAIPRVAGALMMSRPGQAYLGNQLLAGNVSPQVRAIADLMLTNSAIAARP